MNKIDLDYLRESFPPERQTRTLSPSPTILNSSTASRNGRNSDAGGDRQPPPLATERGNPINGNEGNAGSLSHLRTILPELRVAVIPNSPIT